MRLIDADKLIKEINNLGWRLYDTLTLKGLSIALETINQQSTAYDVDKVVEELESNSFITVNISVEKEVVLLKDAIEIVKQGGISNDVCEWHKVKNGNAYKCNTHEEIHDTRVLDWCRCPYCGKKIEVVE